MVELHRIVECSKSSLSVHCHVWLLEAKHIYCHMTACTKTKDTKHSTVSKLVPIVWCHSHIGHLDDVARNWLTWQCGKSINCLINSLFQNWGWFVFKFVTSIRRTIRFQVCHVILVDAAHGTPLSAARFSLFESEAGQATEEGLQAASAVDC